MTDPVVENAAITATEILGLVAGVPASPERTVVVRAIIERCRRDALAAGKRAELVHRYLAEVARAVDRRLAVMDYHGAGHA